MITIRTMTKEDWEAVAAIYQAGMDTNLATFQTECPSYTEWDAGHLSTCRLVADDDGSVAGWAALSAVSSRCVYSGVAEVSIYISGAYRGKGVGTVLLNALSDASEAAGIWTLQSGIMADNTASIKLHEKCGYRMIGKREKIGCDRNGVWRDTVLVERRSKVVGH
ncbi:N-acetyltransferase family protein [Eubacteriales bacterium OttesenSCG-928-A19]|nr:N-acetyltransferase family protein [Eubacteriales bacterium OttesenSCG-928-A19]